MPMWIMILPGSVLRTPLIGALHTQVALWCSRGKLIAALMAATNLDPAGNN